MTPTALLVALALLLSSCTYVTVNTRDISINCEVK